MAASPAFKITYPSSVAFTTVDTCYIVYNLVNYPMTGCSLDTSNSILSVTGGFAVAVPAGASIEISFGPVTNPITSIQTGTF
jgi:hypothetical protein